jgi:hypothetical protein
MQTTLPPQGETALPSLETWINNQKGLQTILNVITAAVTLCDGVDMTFLATRIDNGQEEVVQLTDYIIQTMAGIHLYEFRLEAPEISQNSGVSALLTPGADMGLDSPYWNKSDIEALVQMAVDTKLVNPSVSMDIKDAFISHLTAENVVNDPLTKFEEAVLGKYPNIFDPVFHGTFGNMSFASFASLIKSQGK